MCQLSRNSCGRQRIGWRCLRCHLMMLCWVWWLDCSVHDRMRNWRLLNWRWILSGHDRSMRHLTRHVRRNVSHVWLWMVLPRTWTAVLLLESLVSLLTSSKLSRLQLLEVELLSLLDQLLSLVLQAFALTFHRCLQLLEMP